MRYLIILNIITPKVWEIVLSFSFVEVNKNNDTHIKYLYHLLKKRDFNISHDNVPDYYNHKEFVLNNKYRKWHFIYKNNNLIGSYYITFENHIGLNLSVSDVNDYVYLLKKILSKNKPLTEIKSERNKSFLINISPNNKQFINAMKLLNFEHIQNTYLCN